MDKITCMRAFCTVVQQGNFTRAAQRLETSKVLISRQVSQLETELGIRLFHRTTRQVSPTEEGRAYYERCVSLLDELDELDASISRRRTQAQGTLRLAVPTMDFTHAHLLPALRLFALEHPKLSLDIELSDRVVDLVGEGFDAAIRIGQLPDSTLIARKLADFELQICAAPALLEAFPTVVEPKDLAALPWVADGNYRGGHKLKLTRGDEHETVVVNGQWKINSAAAVATLLTAQTGAGLVPDFAARELLAQGHLKRVLSQWHVGGGGVYLVYHHRRHLSAKIQQLIDTLTDHFNSYTY